MEGKLQAYEERRRIEREREEEELRLLKEKRERRRVEREEEEVLLAERIAGVEARRQAEEDELRKKRDVDKKKREEERRKRKEAQAHLRLFSGEPNFTVEKAEKGQSSFDKFGSTLKAKAERGMTREQKEANRIGYMQKLMLSEELQITGLTKTMLMKRIRELHVRASKLEANKYDLEQRERKQEYDLKELKERQRQIGRKKHMAKGLNPDEESSSSNHPPKIAVISKYERQIDRRSFHQRKEVYDKNGTFPHFPNCPPPIAPLLMEIKPYDEVEDSIISNYVEEAEEEEETESEEEED